MRMTGLASGMDIETMINKMMDAERIPLTKLEQKKTVTEWKRDEYRELNKMLSELDTFLFDNMTMSSKMSAKKASSSNTNAISVSASSSAPNVNVNMSVEQLATSASWQTTVLDKNKLPLDKDYEVEFQVKNPGETTYTSVKVSLSATDDYGEIAKKINNSKVGMTALYDEKTGKFALTANKTGEGIDVKLNSDGASVFNQLGFKNIDSSNTFSPTTEGKNAKFTYNGVEIERESNTFEINGLNITLKSTTAKGELVTLSTEADSDAVIKVVEDFVNKYNDIVKRFSDEYGEKKNRSYVPLTDEQKKEMSDDQIKLWEEKAKSGLLRGDSTISTALSNMRNIMNFSPELKALGITPSANYTENGKLTLDKDKLRKAITENADVVYDTFKGKGITDSLRNEVKSTVKKIEGKAGNTLKSNDQFTLGKELKTLDERISAMQARLETVEARYYKQFSAMEAAIQKSNSQSDYIYQMFSQ